MNRTCTTLLALQFAVLAVAQPASVAKPDWPQPIIRGSMVVWGGEDGKAQARQVFERIAGDGKILVLSSTADTARATWAENKNAKVVSVLDDGDLESFSFIWLDSFTLGSQSTRTKLKEIKDGGGAVAMSEELLATGQFRPLFPYATVANADTHTAAGALDMDISDDGVVLLRGRYLIGYGEGQTKFHLAAGAGLEATEVVIESGGRQDLISLHRRTIDRTLPPFPVRKSPKVPNGTLVIVGGGGMPAGLLDRFIALAGGPDAPIVYVPCTFAEEVSAQQSFVRALKGRGATNVTVFHTKDRVKADSDKEFLALMKDAKGVWFGGGRQWNLVDSYMDTQAHQLMRDVLKRGGVIGGSSAGASIQAEFLARGDPLGNLNILAPGYLRGLGFLPGVAVDQHFTQRGRQKDMTELMKAYPQVLGIGIDEATAIIVQGSLAEVVGRGAVHFYDYTTPPEGDTDYLRLEKGKKYDLAKRREFLGGIPEFLRYWH